MSDLGRIFGPDTLALLDAHLDARIERALNLREAEKRWLSTEAAAEYLGVTASGIRKMVGRGELRYSRLNRRLLIDRRDLDRRLENGRL